jgi:hypothetical protein
LEKSRAKLMDTLEQEIALALTSPGTTSAELAQRIDQATTAAAAADEQAAKERRHALDPAVLVDTQAVSAAVVAAELKRDRLAGRCTALAATLRQSRGGGTLCALGRRLR